ncbi:MAG: SDR family oxidoreductase [Flavobacteriales bacterium]|nr:SDR family oxidoreductase [Flavobacteriales bacterium]
MNILITGGSKGIGAELVKQFAADKENYIVTMSRNYEELILLKEYCYNTNGNTINIYKVDFSEQNIENTLNEIIHQENRHFHIVINNAGALLKKSFLEIDKNDWNRILNINIVAPAILTKQIIKHNNKVEFTHVVNIGSMGGFQGSSKFAGLAAYSSSKAALSNLTELLAEEFKETNFKFNCLALGSVQTEMLQEAFPGYKAQLTAGQIAVFIKNFSITAHTYINGKIIPISTTTP